PDPQRRAVAAADEGRTGTARKLFRSALQHESDPVGRARILISLAFYEAERDGPAAGLALLSGADDTNELPRWMHGLVLGQRALIQLRAGDPPAAMKDFDGAARLLTEHHPEDLCKVLLNRGVLALQQRHPERAGDDFT